MNQHGYVAPVPVRRALSAVVIFAVLLIGCGSAPLTPMVDAMPSPTTITTTITTTPAPTSTTPGTPSTSTPTAITTPNSTTSVTTVVGPRAMLVRLTINDAPDPSGYRREDWPHWRDVDGDGCDAREQALVAASVTPAQVDRGCTVVSGRWVSAYDGITVTVPRDLDVDHVVPLADAYASGGRTWTSGDRTSFANDPAGLWVVSASTNRSKGDRSPDEWRPPVQAVWCDYASRWVSIKVRWQLTATSPEHATLGQMLDTCPTGAP